jgi:hypothetical protein
MDAAGSPFLQGRVRRPGRESQRGRETEQQSGAQGHHQHEAEHRPVHPCLGQTRHVLRSEGGESLDRPVGHQDAERTPEAGQHQVFGQGLPQQVPSARADRRADRHLPPPRGALGEQQVGDVGAGDEQHEPDRAQ